MACKEENNKTKVVPQLPRASGTQAASACAVTMGGRGKKGLRNLAEELNGVERRGEGLGRGGLGGGGRSAAAGGRRARRSKSASQTLQQSPELGRRRRPGGGTTRPRARPPARARRWPRVRRCARQRCWSEAGASRGAEGGRGGGAPSWSEPGACGSEPRRPRVSGGRGRGLGKRPPAPPETVRGGVGVGRQGRGGVGAARTCGPPRGGLGGGEESFLGKARPSYRVRISPRSRGTRRRGKQVVELAPCLPTRPCQCWAEGRPPCVRGGGPDTGGRADVSPRSAALSALSAGRFLPRCSRSCCPGRPGRRRAQLPASRPGASLLCCSPDSGPGKVNGKRAALPVPTSAPGPGRRYLFFPSREAPWTQASTITLLLSQKPGSRLR